MAEKMTDSQGAIPQKLYSAENANESSTNTIIWCSKTFYMVQCVFTLIV